MESLYKYIFKRKSFHLFRNNKTKEEYNKYYHISDDELNDIYKIYKELTPLIKDIKTDIRIVSNELTNCKRYQEYCILFYSEKKNNYLQNIGYIGEQLDLYLASKNIGCLWYGIGKTNETTYNGLEYVTMMAISKVPNDSFRKDMYKSKRKSIDEIWEGNKYVEMANIVRFSPSSCNTQPWFVKEDNNKLLIYRYRKEGKRGIMPKNRVIYQNLIDIGIFLLFIELYLKENKLNYSINIHNDNELNEDELTLNYEIIIE